ncbi:alpha/beta hydrolase [Arthrobacter sp. efr-133-TYG-118]|uniref:alpha/beta hydrolase n=1 Tax=Arthrobacter sp. efr-133-TYG-118 TaxID=3040279 RepID=UPI00254C1117|nr:alpha/beta hydrolase [Arthrobacter sp. efr-133-TYG-118]
MTEEPGAPVRTLPARHVPVPQSLSEGARKALELSETLPRTIFPAAHDDEAWRQVIGTVLAQEEQLVSSGIMEMYISGMDADVALVDVGGVPVGIGTPRTFNESDPRGVLVLHGGGWIQGGGPLTRMTAALEASKLGLRTWAVDYRMLPDHAFPAHLDDCVTVYRALLRQTGPENIAVMGTSAGGNLAAAMLLRARDEGLPTPAALGLWSPSVDLTRDGDSWHTNDGLDPIIGQHMGTLTDYYARGHDPRDPYLSPIFGDVSEFPPTILVSGTRDGLLSDTVRFHRALRRAGVPAELHVFEGLPHGGFDFQSPEDLERDGEFRAFFHKQLSAGGGHVE